MIDEGPMDEEGDDFLTAFFQSNALFSLLLVSLLIIYFASERSVLHVSRNLRRMYFLVLVTLLSWWLLSAVQNASSGGMEILLIFVVIIASIVEDKMERSIYLTPFSSRALEEIVGTPEAIGKAELLDSIARGMNRWQGFSIGLSKQLAWLDGSLHKRQAAIHQVMQSAEPDELNFILAHNNCANMLEVAAEKTIELLTDRNKRLRDLTTLSRAILVDGFQKIGLRHRPLRQLHVHRILMNTHAEDLSELKSFLDDGPDYHTTFKLVYDDLQGELRQEVLEHVSVEGHRALAYFRKKHPGVPGMTLKVVSDIDDTLMCSGGHFPAGADNRYPKSCVYPGVLAFYKGLDAAFVDRIWLQNEAEASSSQQTGDTALRRLLRRESNKSLSFRHRAVSPKPRDSPGGRSPSPPRQFRGFQVVEQSEASSKLTATNLEDKRQLERQMSPQPANSGHLESIAESSLPGPLTESDITSCLPAQDSRRLDSLPNPEQESSSDSSGLDSQGSTNVPVTKPSEGGHSGGLNSHPLASVSDLRNIPPRPPEPADSRHSLQGPATSYEESDIESHITSPRGYDYHFGFGEGLSRALNRGPSAGSMKQMRTLSQFITESPGPTLMQPGMGRVGEKGKESLTERDGTGIQQKSGHLVFLSARPESYKGFTEGISFKRIFEPLVRRGDLYGYPVLLLGSLRVGPVALYAYAADRRGSVGAASMRFYSDLAYKKLARFRQFEQIYPECCWIFCGDNGQGDLMLAEKLNEFLKEKLLGCFINEVVPVSETVSKLRRGKKHISEDEARAWPQIWKTQKIYLARDYISLAAEAHKQQLLDLRGLRQVALEAIMDLRHIMSRYAHSSFTRADALAELNAGIDKANAILPHDLRIDRLPQPEPMKKLDHRHADTKKKKKPKKK